jgi:hypothetical protein
MPVILSAFPTFPLSQPQFFQFFSLLIRNWDCLYHYCNAVYSIVSRTQLRVRPTTLRVLIDFPGALLPRFLVLQDISCTDFSLYFISLSFILPDIYNISSSYHFRDPSIYRLFSILCIWILLHYCTISRMNSRILPSMRSQPPIHRRALLAISRHR